MINTKELQKAIYKLAPKEIALEWDNEGVNVEMYNETEKILFALDATKEVIDETKELGCGIIVTHHPIIFAAVKGICADDAYVYAAKQNISVISAHTNLDGAKGGVNDVLCGLFGIKKTKLFEEVGRGGEIERTTGENLAALVKERLKLTAVRVINKEKTVKRVAVVGGQSGECVLAAAREGYDAFITGEIKHHEMLAAKALGLCVIDAGHYGTENPVMEPFRAAVQKEIGKKAECVLSRKNSSPSEFII